MFGVAILGAVFQHSVVLPGNFVAGFRTVLLIGAGVLTFGGLATLFLPRMPRVVAGVQTAENNSLAESYVA